MAITFQLLASCVWALVVNAHPAVEQTCPAGGCAEAKQDGDDETKALRVSLLQYKAGSTAADAESATMDEDQRPNFNSGSSQQRECTGFPNPNGYNNRDRCTGGTNQINSGYTYIYNSNRYGWNPACGSNTDCWCCKEQKRECVGWDQVPNYQSWQTNKQNCQGGGYGFIYNSNRGQSNAGCGQTAQCYCCQIEGTGPPRRRRGFSPPRRRRGGFNPPRRRRGGWNPPRRRRGGRSGQYQIFSGYNCQNGFQPISNPTTCQLAANEAQRNHLTVDQNVPSSSQNPHGCYIYGNPGSYSNLYYNYAGTTSGTWPQRNVVCKRGYSSLAQTTDEEQGLESKKTQILEELQAIDAELAEIGDAEEVPAVR